MYFHKHTKTVLKSSMPNFPILYPWYNIGHKQLKSTIQVYWQLLQVKVEQC